MPLPPSSSFQEQGCAWFPLQHLGQQPVCSRCAVLGGPACREGVQVNCCSGLCWLWGKRGRRSHAVNPSSPSRPPPGNSAFKSPDAFKVSLPLRTNYLYGKIKKTLPELYAFTICLWLRSSASPGIGTPFSYAVPGQANEIVLIEWGNNPIELLINDKVSPLGRPPLFPLSRWPPRLRCCRKSDF